MKKVFWIGVFALVASIGFGQQAPEPDQQEFDGYAPPACTGIFSDIPCPSPYANWVERLWNEGITNGCSAVEPTFCPDSHIDREHMAVFVLRVEHRIYARFGSGSVFCTTTPSAENDCEVSVTNAAVHPESNIQCTYFGTGADVSIPCRVKEISEGEFKLEIQNNRTVMWLSFDPNAE